MTAPKLKLMGALLHRTETKTRMPFRFGIAVMTAAPHVFLQCDFDIEGKLHRGISAEGLLPKWFDKTPEKSAEHEIEEMLLVIRHAVEVARSAPAANAFSFWRSVYDDQMKWASENALPPLLAHFGVSMVERTMIDALARSQEVTLSQLLRTNLLGMDLASIHPELGSLEPADLLPAKPLSKIVARHTIGLSDPLTASDLTDDNRVDDGLPQTFEDCIRTYGLHHFKLKVSGDVDVDIDRLRKVAKIIIDCCGDRYAFTLDGNEQYHHFADFVELWERIQADSDLRAFFTKLIFIEQPLHRSVALDESRARIAAWEGGPPMIIDESDATIDSLAQALKLGYTGTSHKNCKGVMKGVANRCLINHRKATEKSGRYQMSGEDLVNIGPVALLQDLAAHAAMGNTTVERNGHHYYRGLSAFPPRISAMMLENHGDLYTNMDDQYARLDVRDGELPMDSVNAAPFGFAGNVSMEGFQKLEV
ncbi:MAG: hypothetical protein AAGA03_11760 [Planctomycetota bacterium]